MFCFSWWCAQLSRRFAWCHACIEDMRGSIYLGTLAVGTLLTVKIKNVQFNVKLCRNLFRTCQGKRILVPNTMAQIITACFMENSNPVIFGWVTLHPHSFIPAFSSPVFSLPDFSSPDNSSPDFSFPHFHPHIFIPTFSSPDFSSPAFSSPHFHPRIFIPAFSPPHFHSQHFSPPHFHPHTFIPALSFPDFHPHTFIPAFSSPHFHPCTFIPTFSS